MCFTVRVKKLQALRPLSDGLWAGGVTPAKCYAELNGRVTDATIESGERIWVGAGMEGHWLTSVEVRELAAAMVKVADTHDARSD